MIYTSVGHLFSALDKKGEPLSREDIERSIKQGHFKIDELKKAINSKTGASLLHASVKAKNLEVAQYLLEIGTDTNIKDYQGKSALFQAFSDNNLNLITDLILHGALIKEKYERTSLLDAFLTTSGLIPPEKEELFTKVLTLYIDKTIQDQIKTLPKDAKEFFVTDQGQLYYKQNGVECVNPIPILVELRNYIPPHFLRHAKESALQHSVYHINNQKAPEVQLPTDKILSYDDWLLAKYKIVGRSERNTLTQTGISGINYIFENQSDLQKFSHLFSEAKHRVDNTNVKDPVYKKFAVLLEGTENNKLQTEYQVYLKKIKETVPRSQKEIESQINAIQMARKNIAQFDKQDVISNPSGPLPKINPRQIISVSGRLDEFQALACDTKKQGLYEYQATSAYKLSLEAYIALKQDSLSPLYCETLKEASSALMGKDVTCGLKADANWTDYLKNHLHDVNGKESGLRIYFVQDVIKKDADDLLDGNPYRQGIDINIPRCSYKGSGDLPVIDQLVQNMNKPRPDLIREIPKFFPDDDGKSDTDSMILQTGGMLGHSAMVKIWKQGVDENGNPARKDTIPAYYKFYRTEYNAGGGAKNIDWSTGTCNAIYTTEIKHPPPPKPKDKADLARYNAIMKSNLKKLIVAEREILFFNQPKQESNAHGEPIAQDVEMIKEWTSRDSVIKELSGTPVESLCRRGVLQRSGNCAMASQRQLLRDQFFSRKLDPSVIEDHWAFAQTCNSNIINLALNDKEKELNLELKNIKELKKTNLFNAFAQYDKIVPKTKEAEGDWKSLLNTDNKSTGWSIARSKYSHNIALANKNFHIEISGSEILYYKKTQNGPYLPIVKPNEIDDVFKKIPVASIQEFVEKAQNTSHVIDPVTALENQIKNVLIHYKDIKETPGWDPVYETKDPNQWTQWEIGKRTIGNIALADENYHIELVPKPNKEGYAVEYFNKNKPNGPYIPIKLSEIKASIPLGSIQNFVSIAETNKLKEEALKSQPPQQPKPEPKPLSAKAQKTKDELCALLSQYDTINTDLGQWELKKDKSQTWEIGRSSHGNISLNYQNPNYKIEFFKNTIVFLDKNNAFEPVEDPSTIGPELETIPIDDIRKLVEGKMKEKISPVMVQSKPEPEPEPEPVIIPPKLDIPQPPIQTVTKPKVITPQDQQKQKALISYMAKPDIPAAIQKLTNTAYERLKNMDLEPWKTKEYNHQNPWPLPEAGGGRKKIMTIKGEEKPWLDHTFGKTEEELLAALTDCVPKTYPLADILETSNNLTNKKTSSDVPQLTIVQGVGVNDLHRTALGNNCLLQVASQFDFQESIGAYDTSISQYLDDKTQGPQAVIEASAAGLARKEAKKNEKLPHALTHLLPKWLLDKYNDPNNYPQLYQDGYLSLSAITEEADKVLLKEHIISNLHKLNILPQWVTCEATKASQMQVFCAAPSFQYANKPEPGSTEAQICEMLVVAQYEAIARLAVIRSRETGEKVPLHLTLVGQGAFRNPEEVIGKAMAAVSNIVKGENVAVYMHAYDKKAQDIITNQVSKDMFNIGFMDAETFKKEPHCATKVQEQKPESIVTPPQITPTQTTTPSPEAKHKVPQEKVPRNFVSALIGLIVNGMQKFFASLMRKPIDPEIKLHNEIEELKAQFTTESEKEYVTNFENLINEIPSKTFNEGDELREKPKPDKVKLMKFELTSFKMVLNSKGADKIKKMDETLEKAKTQFKVN